MSFYLVSWGRDDCEAADVCRGRFAAAMSPPGPRFAPLKLWLLLLAMMGLSGLALAASAPRERLLVDSGWRFHLGDPVDITNPSETNVTYYPEIPNLGKLDANEVSGTSSETYLETLRPDPVATHMGESVSFVQTNFDDSAWHQINLPHDWAVELLFDSSADGGHGYKPIGPGFPSNSIGWYRRTFTLPASDVGQTMWLEFDGVYRNCLVWLNGHILGRNVSGYSSFYFNISQYADPGGTNVLVVRVDASRFEGWFYEGAGIYRHVWLVTTSPAHVAHWGTYVTSTVNGANAAVTVQTQVNNDNTHSMAGSLVSTILDSNSNAVATATQALNIPAGSNQVVMQTLSITNVKLWSLTSPNLYGLVSTVVQSGVTNDVYQTPFGVRTIQFDSNNGLFLNGQRVAIQGMCNHQDHAGVGSALPDRIQYYRIERLKEMGCNVYRTSHNPPTPELLDACDQLGMLVLDENRRIGTNAEPMSELRRLILRDRDHPCVFCWSLANEEPLQRNNSVGTPIMQAMVNLVHQLDPSRKCTAAMNSYSSGVADGFSKALDVQGFNYLNNGNMDGFHSANPAMPCLGTEEASTYYTRGIYANTSTYVSAYDVNTPGYGSSAEGWWQYYTARPWASGACVWTGFDYRGEPSPFGWPDISSEFGAMDTCGFPKDVYYYYQANWTGKNVLHIFPQWNWPGKEGQAINVWCYSDCDAVEVFLNGVSQGMKTVNVKSHEEWNVPYAPGTLEAVGYRNGRPVITNVVVTTGAPAGIVLEPDRRTILADGRDVSLVKVAVVDSEGRIVPTATNTINFVITSGAIIGVGNGDPACHEADKPASPASAVRSVFNGLVQVIVQSTNEPGPIVLTATSPGLNPTNVTITAALSLPPPATPTNVLAAAGDGTVRVDWDGVPGATRYNVKRGISSGGPYATVASLTADSYFTDTGLTDGTTYYYVVSAVSANGESGNSMEVSAKPLPLPVPTPPANLKAAPLGSTQISLNWDASPAATGYNVMRSTLDNGPYAQIGTTEGASFVDTGLTNTTTYYYVLSATNNAGVSANSAQASARPGLPSPVAWFKADAITNLADGASVETWNDSGGHFNSAFNPVAAQEPTFVTGAINGLPAVHFSAADSSYLAFNRVVQDDFTIACVFQSTQGLNTGTQFWQGAGLVNGEVQGTENDFGTSLNAAGQVLAGVGNPDTTAASGAGYNDGRPHLLTFVRSKATGQIALYLDGSLVAKAAANNNSLVSPPQLVIGAQQTLNNFFSGDIAETEVFNTALINMDLQTMEGALISKYAIGNTNLVSIGSQPSSLSFSSVYAGVPVTFTVKTSGASPIVYQWYQVRGGTTNAIDGATGASFTHLSQSNDAGTLAQYFVVASNSYGSTTSRVASLSIGHVVRGPPGPVSIQFSITNYSGYSGFPLAPADTAGVFALSNWNTLVITPDPSGADSTVSTNYLADYSGVATALGLTVANVNDGWHQNAAISGSSSANARLMNTFWKANPNEPFSASTLRMTLTNPPGGIYDVYVYLMQNTPSDGVPAGYLYAANGVTNYFTEFVNFDSSSNFVTAVDTNGAVFPTVNYLKLAHLSTGGSNALTLTTVWTGGGDGLGVCGLQIVPPIALNVGGWTNGQFSFSFPVQINQSYVIESSTNLVNWTPILTNLATTSPLVFTSSNATDTLRFYRVRQ